jgi:hypothetical protein
MFLRAVNYGDFIADEPPAAPHAEGAGGDSEQSPPHPSAAVAAPFTTGGGITLDGIGSSRVLYNPTQVAFALGESNEPQLVSSPTKQKSPSAGAGRTSSTANTGAKPVAPPTVGLFSPGQGELGLQEFVLQPGQTPFWIFQQNGLFKQLSPTEITPTLNANLAATPSLDPTAFGTRPGNPPDLSQTLPIGETITVLDSTRLGYLEQERTQLATIEASTAIKNSKLRELAGTANSTEVGNLVATLYQELNYAGTQQAVPDAEALASSIRARAPNDAIFQSAVNDAVALYRGTLATQGRTSGQIGQIDTAAAAGDWSKVQALTEQQIIAVVGKDQGSLALGDITARSSVYLTYAGGDPRFAQAVEQGVQAAQNQVMIDRPIAALQAAYTKAGGNAAMKLLNQLTDPQTMTPAQVGQIMSDPRTQAIIKQSIENAQWSLSNDADRDTQSMMNDLQAACQHATESDLGKPGLGMQAVDAVAGYIVSESSVIAPNPYGVNAPPLQLEFLAAGSAQGNVSLSLAVAAAAGQQKLPDLQSVALLAVREGIDQFSESITDLETQTSKDAMFLRVPLKDWGADSTPAQQQAIIQQLIADNPAQATQLNNDGLALTQKQEDYSSVQMAINDYEPALNGVAGFNRDANRPVAYSNWAFPSSPSVVAAFHKIPALSSGFTPASDITATNTLWLQRSARKVFEQAVKGLIKSLPTEGADAVISADGAKIALNAWSRINKTVGTVLYFLNADYTLSTAATGGLLALQDDASGIRQYLAGVSYALSATLPKDSLGEIRPGSGVTPLAKANAALTAKLDGLAIPDTAKSGLKILVEFGSQDLSDFASAILGTLDAAEEFSAGENWKAAGNVLNALGYSALLTGPGIDASDLPDGATILGLDASGWTGIGAVLVLAGAVIYTAADAYSNSHAYDKNDYQTLLAMGVHSQVAGPLSTHSTALNGAPPTAGTFLTAYFKYLDVPQQGMVHWLNALTPQQANSIATVLKAEDGEWQNQPMQQNVQAFNQALLQVGLTPPVQVEPMPPMQLVAGTS